MYKRIISSALSVIMLYACFFMSGCAVEENVFPQLNFTDESMDIADPTDTEDELNTSDLHEIMVALPLSDRTVNLLMKLYYAKNNGLFTTDMTGSDISIEYLDAISTNWIVNTVTSVGTGETYDALQDLHEDDIYPDLFVASDINDMIEHGSVIPIDPYLSGDYSIMSTSIYTGALEALRTGSDHYGIPFYSTVYLLTGSTEYLPESGVPAYNLTSDELEDYIRDIPGISPDGTAYITRFYNASELSPFMGEEFSSGLINEGLSSNTDNFGADPRVSRLCGMWLMNSGEFDTWNFYYPDGLYFTMLPSENVNAVVYPLCLSSDSADPEFAAGFASFLCFDKDAQMLIRRLESLSGYFPPVSYGGVWDEVITDEQFGSTAMLYEQYMDQAVYTAAED